MAAPGQRDERRRWALAVGPDGSLYAGGGFTTAGGKPCARIARWTAADGRAISGPGTYTFYAHNLPVTIAVPPGGQGDLARINIQRFDKSHANATTPIQTGYYWQIEGLNASGGTASGYSVNLTLSAPGFTPDGDDKVCQYTAGFGWDCAMSNYDAGVKTITRNGVTSFSEWAVGDDVGPTAVDLRGFSARTRPAVSPRVGAHGSGWGRPGADVTDGRPGGSRPAPVHGAALSFYGGVSVQNLLPHGTPQQVRDEVRRLIDEVGRGGGFIVGPSHDMPGDIPVENMVAFIETVRSE